jgi:hypothetical protein
MHVLGGDALFGMAALWSISCFEQAHDRSSGHTMLAEEEEDIIFALP